MIVLAILLFAASLSCVSADDTADVDAVLEASQDDAPALEIQEDAVAEKDTANDSKANSSSKAFLIIDNDADKENVYISDLVIWSIGVLNAGPDTAENVNVYDQLPDGMEYVSHIATKGDFDPVTGIWNIGSLSIHDGIEYLDIVTKALTAGEKVNKANVTSDTYNLNENNSYEEEEIDVLSYSSAGKDSLSHYSANALYSTGNPIVLILISIIGIIFSFAVKDK